MSYEPFQRYLGKFGIANADAEIAVLVRNCFHALFKRSSDLQRFVMDLRARAGIKENEPYISAHMRIGTKWGDPQRHRPDLVIPKVIACAGTMQSFMQSLAHTNAVVGSLRSGNDDANKAPVYIASDVQKAKEMVLEAQDISHAVAVMNLPLYHVDRYGSNPTNDMALKGYLSAWAEFFVLVDAECCIESSSGFSHWANRIAADNRGNRCYASIAIENGCSLKVIQSHVDQLSARTTGRTNNITSSANHN